MKPTWKEPQHSIIRSNAGFTIVEVMIAGLLAVVVSLAIATLIVDMSNHRRAAEEKSDVFGTVQQISYDLRYRAP